MGLSPSDSSIDAIWHLATYTDEILTAVSHLAVSYNITIIAGSMPVVEEEELYNVSYICKRDGTIESQYKLHPTPHEKEDWSGCEPLSKTHHSFEPKSYRCGAHIKP